MTKKASLLAGIALLALASTADAADKIKVGFMSTLSGPGAALGVDIRDGFELVAKGEGGKLGGLTADISIADDQQSPDTGRQVVERFTKRDRVDVITGMVFSNVLLPVMPAILASGTVYISPNTGPEDYAAEKCDPNFFVVSWQNEDTASAMGQVMNDRSLKNVYLIAPNYPGGRETLNGFKRTYKGAIAGEVYTRLGQLDYAAEIATLRAARPDAVFFFLPGGMGTNFIKQYVSAGAQQDARLYTPGYSADEDTIKSVGEPMVGILNTAQWAHDLDNPANRKFVADFQKAYGRLPTMYAQQGYDAAQLIAAAVRDTGGRIEDKAAFRQALHAARFDSPRGRFRFNTNNYPIQDYYLREVVKDGAGRITNKTIGKVYTDYADPFAARCKMK
ncbi:ABC transporter substrate-binding protein [Vineibacter terrae]|uniref:ABC transporter substrate-binding protein n=1 Tax=Vineibacter terrae TaxID=2586908 RepID=A0A5C8P8B0_9HYPH|nr:ABC transporter substrate-binding protein [Vineibacter terrae]TXL70029.1 ABC transporter substrate-binding protein [Vineibacter terrae]